MTASVGAIVVELAADTAQIKRDMANAVAILNSGSAQMNRAMGSVKETFATVGKAAAAFFAVDKIGDSLKSQIALGDQLAKTSQKIGASVENLSAYQYAAKLSGVESDELTASLAKLAKNMEDAIVHRGGEAAEQFRALGIQIVDANGKLRSTDAVFEDLAKRFAHAPDGPEKTAAAIRLLGKSGQDMIPLLNGLKELTEEAKKTGNVISTDFAQKAEHFNDTLERMHASTGRLTRSILMDVVPAMNYWIERLNVARGAQERLSLGALEDALADKQKRFKELSEQMKNGFVIGGWADTAIGRERAAIAADISELEDMVTLEKNRAAALAQVRDKEGKKNIQPLNQIGAEKFGKMQEELRLATRKANAEILNDDAERARLEIGIAQDAMRQKVEYEKLGADQRKAINDDLMKYDDAVRTLTEKKYQGAFKDTLDEWRNTTRQLQDASAGWLQGTANALTQFVMTGKLSFKDLANSIISDLVRISIQKQLVGLFGSFGSSSGAASAGLMGGLSGHAAGGDPTVGEPTWVGERGPEIFIPKVPGTIVPNDKIGHGGRGGTYYIDARGADQAAVSRLERVIQQVNGSIEHRAISAVGNARMRGGQFAAMFDA